MPASALYPKRARGKRVLWLLMMEWAGHVIRVAEDELDVETEDGQVLHFYPGLSPLTFAQRLEMGGDASGMGEQPVEMLLPEGISVTELVELGHDLSAAQVELARWIEGTTWESRCVRIEGRATGAEHETDDDPIAFTISANLADDATMTGSPATRVLGVNWANADSVPSQFLGEQYPIIIGRPGQVSETVDPSGRVSGGWATWIDYRRGTGAEPPNLVEIRALIAGHHVQVGSVYVCTDDSPGLAYRVRVANGHDDQGRPVAFLAWFYDGSTDEADHDGLATYTFYDAGTDIYGLGSNALPGSFNGADAKRLYISLVDEADATAGGLEVDGKLLRDVADVIVWACEQTGRKVDHGRMRAAAAALSRFKIDGVIIERTGIWEWLRDSILPLLPVSLATGPDGLYAVVWQAGAAGPGDGTFVIDRTLDPRIDRASPQRTDDGDRLNRVTVKYAYRFRTKQYAGSITLGTAADAAEAADGDVVQVSAACERCRAQLRGEVRERVIQTAYVYDDSTAQAVAESLVDTFAGRRRTVEYVVPEEEFLHVQLGARGNLVDPDMKIDGARVQLIGMAIEPDGMRLELLRRDQ